MKKGLLGKVTLLALLALVLLTPLAGCFSYHNEKRDDDRRQDRRDNDKRDDDRGGGGGH